MSMDMKRSREEARSRACLTLKCSKRRHLKCLIATKRSRKAFEEMEDQRGHCDEKQPPHSYPQDPLCHKAGNDSPRMKFKVGHTPSGTMAPCNTTQYLTNIVYQDLAREDEMRTGANINTVMDLSGHDQCRWMYGDYTSPQKVYICLDSAYESTLEFQERDFETVFHL